MLRSTVYPGITEKISLEVRSYGLNTFVSFCPERITEGNALEEIRILPQIIGADSEPSYLISEKVFNGVSPKCIRTTFKEAEISKLFANAFRYFKFAIANEFFELCVNENINWENVWYSLKEEYPRAKDLPLPGFAAGPCLVKDTLQLDYFAENKFNISKAAIKVNEEMPDFIIEQLQKNYDLSNMIVGILGMTFKANVDDFRSSLSFRLKNLLQNVAKEVLCSDEVLQKDYFITSDELLAKSDIVIIATPHKEYSKLSIDKPLVDIWRINSSVSIF
jgi:UDP-N-acetyl-D-mannosaminuronic acid dehydrogenase